MGQAPRAIVGVAGERARHAGIVGELGPVPDRVIGVGQHHQGLHPARARGGREHPVEPVVGEGEVAVVVGDRGHVAHRVVAEGDQVVQGGDLGQAVEGVVNVSGRLALGVGRGCQVLWVLHR